MKFYLDTDHPVALDSLDQVYPMGTRTDNTINLKFNKKSLCAVSRKDNIHS